MKKHNCPDCTCNNIVSRLMKATNFKNEKELAYFLHYSPQHLSRLKSGRLKPPKTVLLILELLEGKKMNELL